MGPNYQLISKERSPEVFKESMRVHGIAENVKITHFVLDCNYVCWSVYEDSDGFIMTETGRTFTRLT